MEELRAFIRTRQPVNLLLVTANLIVFVVLSILGDTEDGFFMLTHGASYTPLILENGEYYRLFTCMFLHFGVYHLFFNMLLLIYIGDSLEKLVGKWRYLVIYLAGGMAGNVLSVFVDMHTENYAISAGASGAIFAVVGALIWIVLRNRGKIEGYSLQRLGLMAVLTVADGFTMGGVDNFAHIGGLAAGFILGALLYQKKAVPGQRAF